MGTRFCATVEAPIHDNVKQFIVGNDERATNLIFRSFKNTGRVAKKACPTRSSKYRPARRRTFKDIQPLVAGAKGRVALETGDLEAGLVWAGQVQGLIHDIPTCGELIGRIVEEARKIIRERLGGMMAGRQ